MLALLTRNLMSVSRLGAAARERGVAVRTVAKAEDVPAESSCVLLDLAERSYVPAEVVRAVRAAAPRASIVAFGPHVDVERLESARVAGCDQVLSRGELEARLGQILDEISRPT